MLLAKLLFNVYSTILRGSARDEAIYTVPEQFMACNNPIIGAMALYAGPPTRSSRFIEQAFSIF